MPVDPAARQRLDAADTRVLSLFEAAGSVETPTPEAAVWLATDPSNGKRPVLIRRLPPGLGKGRATEALTLHHQNIVQTRRWLAEGGNLYLVRDVVRGRNLRQTIAGIAGGPDLEQLHNFLMPVFDALQFAHERGIAHGGLCPENILITDDGSVRVCDWGASDPRAVHHLQAYSGSATVGGDVVSAGRLLATYLPTRGAFASPMVRGRIEGVIARCDTLAQLRETLQSLDRLAAMPMSRPAPPTPTMDSLPLPAPLAPAADPQEQMLPAPSMSTELVQRTPIIAPGGGGSAILVIRNQGDAPLIIRMVATQHAWVNVKAIDLPLHIPPGGSAPLEFAISAARLSAGEYRSEVYLSANVGGTAAEDLRGGWFKHTGEIRIAVGMVPAGRQMPVSVGGGASGPNHSLVAESPSIPATGCAGSMILVAILVCLPALAAFLQHSAAIVCTLP